jgi:hypothetical protein
MRMTPAVNVMRMASAMVALVLITAAPAHALDLYSAGLYSGSANGLQCTVINKGPGDMTVTIVIREALLTGEILATCGPVEIGPQEETNCVVDPADRLAFCKVSTTKPANTRSVFSVLGAIGSQSSANTVPR